MQSALKILLAAALVAIAMACQPEVSSPVVAQPEAPSSVAVRILGDGTIAINDAAVSRDDLHGQLAILAAMNPQPEVHIEPEAGAPYGAVADAMAALQRAGLRRWGVIGGT